MSLETLEAYLKTQKALEKSNLMSWDTYIQSRPFVRDWVKQDAELRQGLLTELLTYPLTLATFLKQLPPHTATTSATTVISVIGARAEATLPPIYWAQIFHEVDHPALTLSFVGPDIPKKLHGKEEELEFYGKKRLIRTFKSEALNEANWDHKPNAIIMFNPGFSHDKLADGWKPSLNIILNASGRVPTLVTGLHQFDAENDHLSVVNQHNQKNRKFSKPVDNPFASMKQHADGLSGRIARANHSMWQIQ